MIMPAFFTGMICGGFITLAIIGAMEWGNRNSDPCQGCQFKEWAEEDMLTIRAIDEWYVEQWIPERCLWVFVKGSLGDIRHANHIVKLLDAQGIRARVRRKR